MKSFYKTIAVTLAMTGALVLTPLAFAMYAETQPISTVSSIALSGSDKNITWKTSGNSAQGFKVVWSKSSGPIYPNRDGDRYHYFSENNKTSDVLEDFAGAGIYYVRVCEYLGGKCGIYSNEIKVTLGSQTERPVACTLEYSPVCGEKQVNCIKAPCPPIKTTYGNTCQLNASKAKFLYVGECKKEEVKKPIDTQATLKLKIRNLEAKVLKVEKENRRLYKLIKLREEEIKTLRESLEK